MSDSPVRRTRSGRDTARSAIQRLQEARKGRKISQLYKEKDDDDEMYKEASDDDLRGFIEDDTGDYLEAEREEAEEEEEAQRGRSKLAGSTKVNDKRKREEEKPAGTRDIGAMLAGMSKMKPIKRVQRPGGVGAPAAAATVTAGGAAPAGDDLLDEILAEVQREAPVTPASAGRSVAAAGSAASTPGTPRTPQLRRSVPIDPYAAPPPSKRTPAGTPTTPAAAAAGVTSTPPTRPAGVGTPSPQTSRTQAATPRSAVLPTPRSAPGTRKPRIKEVSADTPDEQVGRAASPIGADFDMIDLDHPTAAVPPPAEFATPERRPAAVEAMSTPPAPSPASVTPSPVTPGAAAAASSVAAGAGADVKLQSHSGADWWAAARDRADAALGASGAAAAVAAGPPAATEAVSELPVDGQDRLAVYWLDAAEEGNTIFLFGKTRLGARWVSCCVVVHGQSRCIYALPRSYQVDANGQPTDIPVQMRDVQRELVALGQKSGIPQTEFLSKPVKRKYGFELEDVPRGEADYVKAVFPGRYSFSAKEGKTFSHVFHGERSLLELFLIKRGLMGPGWIFVRAPKQPAVRLSWCVLEAEVSSPKDVSVWDINVESTPPPPPPPLVVLSFSAKVVQRRPSSEIVGLSAVVHTEVNMDGATEGWERVGHFSMVRKLDKTPFPVDFEQLTRSKNLRVEVHSNERALLHFFLMKVHQIDPDVIVGHHVFGFGLDVMLHRLAACNTPLWSRIGRLHRHHMPRLSASGDSMFAVKQALAGRLVLDTWLSAKELIRETSYSLAELSRSLLDVEHPEIEVENTHLYFRSAADLLYLVEHCEKDAFLAYRLMHTLEALPLSKQLTNLSGNLWSRTLAGGRAERIEYLLLHEFEKRKYIVPDKITFKMKKAAGAAAAAAAAASGGGGGDLMDDAPVDDAPGTGRKKRKPAYMGGLVLEPKRGLYDKFVLLLDFNSLYPSIIQEFNICFTTVERPKQQPDGSFPPAQPPPKTVGRGVLPDVIAMLVRRRREVKKLLASETDKVKAQQLDIRQKALKLTANSMYGCLGFGNSRFYAKPLAELITSKGREILQKTVDMAQDLLKLEVIYGDTDSIMINTGSTDLAEVREKGNMVKREVNKLYKHLEIDIDGIFNSMLLLKKKKYAAMKMVERPGAEPIFKRETKGLDMVRRDWCQLSKKVGEFVLDCILSGDSRDDVVAAIHNHLRTVAADIRENRVPLRMFIITKGLTKAPEDYPDAHAQPHVKVALRLKQMGRTVSVGDHVPYVICKQVTPPPQATAGAGAGTGADAAPAADGAAAAAAAPAAAAQAPAQAPAQAQPPQSQAIADRAYHPDEVMKSGGSLVIDVDWYISQQVYPPVMRLCSPIEGTDAAMLAECLGLDASHYHHSSASKAEATGADPFERYRNCLPLTVRCRHCHRDTTLGPADAAGSSLRCTQCHQRLSAEAIIAQMRLEIRNMTHLYYQYRYKCGECQIASRTMPRVVAGRLQCERCHSDVQLEWPAERVAEQLGYYMTLADPSMNPKPEPKRDDGMDTDEPLASEAALRTYAAVREFVRQAQRQCAAYTLTAEELAALVTPAAVRMTVE